MGSWTVDGLDDFILVFVLTDVAPGLKSTVTTASLAITLTLLLRPIGAIIFGALAERFGRKHILALNIVLYSAIEVISARSPTMFFFLATRIFYGITNGGICGVASALTMETAPQRSRGWVSGIFQAGYPTGYLIAAILYGVLGEAIGWRGLFALGGLPVLLAIYMWTFVKESPVWLERGASKKIEAPLVGGVQAVVEGHRPRDRAHGEIQLLLPLPSGHVSYVPHLAVRIR